MTLTMWHYDKLDMKLIIHALEIYLFLLTSYINSELWEQKRNEEASKEKNKYCNSKNHFFQIKFWLYFNVVQQL